MARQPFVIVYEVPPLDWWGGWIDLNKYAARQFASDHENALAFEASVHALLRRAEEVARLAGWEGDMREGPFLSALPGDNQSHLLLAWKQDNNGTTYIASEIPLHHLHEQGYHGTSG